MGQRILVIEDDANIQGYAKTVLENAGFESFVCGTAAEARKIFHSVKFDLLIIDIGLPDGNGLELAKEFNLAAGGDPPFMFLTASSDLKTRLKCFNLGAQDYIPKPFAVEELLARVQAHLKLKQSRDTLARRNYELELRHRARQDLTDMIVHDLKAPLASIKGTLQLAAQYGLISDKDHHNLLTSAGTAAEFMLLMLNDLLDLGQAETACLKPDLAAVQLDELAGKVSELFRGWCRNRGVSLRVVIPPESSRLISDANLLFRILVNLASNALKFSPRGTEVTLEAARTPAGLRVAVCDRGPGIPKEQKPRLFDKYATGDRSQGTGVGLAFCRAAAQALRGDIHVEDRPGGGSVFALDLPQPTKAQNGVGPGPRAR
ncbi:MAG: response regulator [Elusimicrobia bacterium]|nr:response regulator [Elusimicrobiota bacterium]